MGRNKAPKLVLSSRGTFAVHQIFICVCAYIDLYKNISIYHRHTSFYFFFFHSAPGQTGQFIIFISLPSTCRKLSKNRAAHRQRFICKGLPLPQILLEIPKRESFTKENRNLRSQRDCERQGRARADSGAEQTGAEPPAPVIRGSRTACLG